LIETQIDPRESAAAMESDEKLHSSEATVEEASFSTDSKSVNLEC